MSMIDKSKNYWKYRPTDPKGEYNKYWGLDIAEGVMCLQQEHIGDVRKYKKVEELIAERPDAAGRMRSVWAFCNKMNIGDIVVVCRDNKSINGIGIVEGDYEYHKEEDESGAMLRIHQRKIKWLSTNPKYDVHHGLQQGSFARFNLSNPKAMQDLEKILEIYGDLL